MGHSSVESKSPKKKKKKKTKKPADSFCYFFFRGSRGQALAADYLA
jgi:hypothetical protein